MHIFMILKCAPTITTVSVHIYIYQMYLHTSNMLNKLTRWGRESLAEISCEISMEWSVLLDDLPRMPMTFPLCGRVVNVFELK